MKMKLALAAMLVALATALGGFASTANAANATQSQQSVASALQIPISSTQSGGVLNGVATITGFAINQAGQLVATGTFVGTATIGGVTQTITSTFSSVLTNTGGSCRILDLTLGPLHLDLLGLVIDLNQVHLTITAQQGPGNLLGNLLCAITNALNGGATGGNALQNLVNLLNQILAGL